MARVTIREIARRAGVSQGAVSYALNNRPGVSAATRARVLRVAAELDWVPNRAARQLSSTRSETVGLVRAGSAESLGEVPFPMGFVAGVESMLSRRAYALALQVVPAMADELATYRRWAVDRRVDGVIVLDPRVDDPRIALLRELGLPAVVAGDPALAGGLTAVWTDGAAATTAAMEHLSALGHQVVGRVAGPPDHGQVWVRDRAYAAAGRRLGLDLRLWRTDFSGEQGAAASRALLAADRPPTALLFDDDLMAVAGLAVANGLGLRVPDDLTLVAWDDSVLCRLTHPTLTALSHHAVAYVAAVATRLLALLDGAPAAAHLFSTPLLVVRDSSAPPAVRHRP